ncbi:hypothetical protein GCM10011521_28330 [Arenimonas soli]|uniref:Uncharacterized protein n=1 Tax=Arenimonas soli TaxID=2269504 RepID=A0ABQ1HT31_9GAMM|nr:hypothetical protein GCM10011521_28330 [Arenimonas soli]
MWFWRDSYFEELRAVASAAAERTEWQAYASYCTQLEKGLRKPALVTLGGFVADLCQQPFSQRRAFLAWLLPIASESKASHMLVPHPLWLGLVRPSVVEWREREPASLEAHRWCRKYGGGA